MTFAALAVIVALGCWRLSEYYWPSKGPVLQFCVPLVLLAGRAVGRVSAWCNVPAFADFLIAVEARDEQGVVADAGRIVSRLDGRDPDRSSFWRRFCSRTTWSGSFCSTRCCIESVC